MNKKIATTHPLVWAPFKGTTFLFDNPAPALTLALEEERFHKINCTYELPSIAFYQQLHAGLLQLNLEDLMMQYSFCSLPFSSYHVTFLSELNDGNKENLATSYRQAFESSSAYSLLGNAVLESIRPNNFSEKIDGGITFEFKALSTFNGNSVLVALLQPTAKDQSKYQQLIQRRKALINACLGKFMLDSTTIPKKIMDFEPHITLGYFAHKNQGVAAKKQLQQWNASIHSMLKNQTIHFESFSLYAFSNMASFLKRMH